jgi:Trk K+ transport system NAD-binding subunit
VDTIFFIVMRRMRTPLIALVTAHSIAVLGLTLIPGMDADGNVWYMDFFHAFYFVSFMASTIGFGEIPYEFTDAQRLWVVFTIYSTVVVWIYSIGNLIRLLQDPAFRQAVTERRFTRLVRRMRERFYLVCGYGETGGALVRALTEREQQAVVVDDDKDRLNLLRMESLRQYVPALWGDAGKPANMLKAGLKHPLCAGVVALSKDNELNLKIAITAKLLHKDITVICRADSHEVEANMESFGTDYIVDPFDTFSLHLATAFQAPCLYLMQEWLSTLQEESLREPIYPPRDGYWVVCGYGRFGKAVSRRLEDEGIKVVVIEATPEKTGTPPDGCIKGWGTEEVTLRKAGIEGAVGLVAGTDNDVNNLSIIMTAREINPGLFVVARRNLRENYSIFDAVEADMVMHPSSIIANKIRVLLASPLLSEFMGLALFKDDAWACELVSRIAALVETQVPEVWELEMQPENALAVCNATSGGKQVTLGDIFRDPRDRDVSLPCIPLLHTQENALSLLPKPETVLKRGDRLLFCGRRSALSQMEWNLQNENVLSYILTGEARAEGWVWRTFREYKARRANREYWGT